MLEFIELISNVLFPFFENFVGIVDEFDGIVMYMHSYFLQTIALYLLNPILKLINNSRQKKIYFSTYCIVFLSVLFQTVTLFSSTNNFQLEEACITYFIYISALLILFLVFAALTSSESYHNFITPEDKIFFNKKEISKIFIIFSILGSAYLLFSIVYCIFPEIYITMLERVYLIEYLKATNLKKLCNVSEYNLYYLSNIDILGQIQINVGEKNGNFNSILIELSKTMTHTESEYANIQNIFISIRQELGLEYVAYILSCIIQFLALMVVIGILMV